MKKIILFSFMLFVVVSCNGTRNNTVSDVQKIKIGMAENEVKYILGEPRDVEIENGYKHLDFIYETKSHRHWFYVYIKNDKVYDFETF